MSNAINDLLREVYLGFIKYCFAHNSNNGANRNCLKSIYPSTCSIIIRLLLKYI
jgi:hypothetical protein